MLNPTVNHDPTILYALGLPPDINYLRIEQIFRQSDMIVAVSIYPESSILGKATGLVVALIQFTSVADSEKAFATLQLSHIPGGLPQARLVLSKLYPLDDQHPAPLIVGRAVTQLPTNMTASVLYDFIRPFGPVEHVEIVDGTGIFHFKDELHAQKVENSLATLDFQSYEPSKLICTKLSPNITEETYKKHFEKLDVGSIVSIELVADKNEGHVVYQTPLMAYKTRGRSRRHTIRKPVSAIAEMQLLRSLIPLKGPPEPDDTTWQPFPTEKLYREIGSLKAQLSKANQNHQIEVNRMKQTLQLERNTFKLAYDAAEEKFRGQAALYQIDSESLKKQMSDMESQHKLTQLSFETQVASITSEKESLHAKLAEVERNCDGWRDKFDVVESRCSVLEFDLARIRNEEARKERERKETDDAQRKRDLDEKRRRMREMMEEERKEKVRREQEEVAQKNREEAMRKAREEEALRQQEEEARRQHEERRKREDGVAERESAWRAATLDEYHRCRVRDYNISQGKHWDSFLAMERFQVVLAEFETCKFSQEHPLTLENIPWPTLSSIVYNPKSLTLGFYAEEITWEEVERFFSTMAFQCPNFYKEFVEKTHRMFHPDKWRARRILDTVQEPTLRKSLESAGNVVSQAITPIWRKSRGEA
ncbi:hypothetical protein H0H93_000214 [Arthromyces matolae]|nr:hypothetical protein H0H93_000214 [Arthromyces matolae]